MSNQAFFLQTLSSEFGRFHNVVAALPADRLDYKHDPKSRSASDLIGHLIAHVQDMIELLDDGVVHHRMQVPFADLAAAVEAFDTSYRTLESKLKGVSDEAWAKPADFFVGDQSVMKAPVQMLMWIQLLDSVHHRGQLSTCIRPMGGKVPALYGPSADTPMTH